MRWQFEHSTAKSATAPYPLSSNTLKNVTKHETVATLIMERRSLEIDQRKMSCRRFTAT
jgi:hypothetical protein